MAWLTIWPMDVVKSQIQSGAHDGKSMGHLLGDVFRTGAMLGTVTRSLRSTVANGSAMVVYKKTESFLKNRYVGNDLSRTRIYIVQLPHCCIALFRGLTL